MKKNKPGPSSPHKEKPANRASTRSADVVIETNYLIESKVVTEHYHVKRKSGNKEARPFDIPSFQSHKKMKRARELINACRLIITKRLARILKSVNRATRCAVKAREKQKRRQDAKFLFPGAGFLTLIIIEVTKMIKPKRSRQNEDMNPQSSVRPEAVAGNAALALQRSMDWLREHLKLEAAKDVLLFLEDKHGEISSALPHAERERVEKRRRSRIKELPIPMTDSKALHETIMECKKYPEKIAAAMELGDQALVDELTRKYNIMRKYIRDCSTPKGSIRNFPHAEVRNYQRAFHNYQYMLKKAKEEDPDVYHYLKQYSRPGSFFGERDEDQG